MDSISELLKGLPMVAEFMQSFDNWVLNYLCWSVATLAEDADDQYLETISPLVRAMPDDAHFYGGCRERAFREFSQPGRAKLLNKALELEERKENLANEAEEHARALQSRIDELNSELAAIKEEVDLKDELIQKIYSAHSYKLGNALLLPVSAAKRLRTRRGAAE